MGLEQTESRSQRGEERKDLGSEKADFQSDINTWKKEKKKKDGRKKS